MVKARDKIAPSLTTQLKRYFWSSGLLGDHSGVAFTNTNFKNSSEHLGFRGYQDLYDAYVQDFELVCIQVEGERNGEMRTVQREPKEDSYQTKHRKRYGPWNGALRDPPDSWKSFPNGDH